MSIETPAEAPAPDAPALVPREPKDLPRALRPHEKLYAKGPRWLSHRELVTLVLGNGTRSEPATRVAERLVRRHGVQGLARLRPEDWRGEAGLGGAAAARLAAAFELGRRAHGREAGEERPRVARPREVFARVQDVARARKEHLVGLYLDAQNGLLHQEVLSIGSLNTTRTHPREILFPAVVHLALGFILVHNHPSGCLEPSPEDLEFTRSVQRAAELFGIELYDHLVVARAGYTSLREMGML
jgi:DNA repair protein RadC